MRRYVWFESCSLVREFQSPPGTAIATEIERLTDEMRGDDLRLNGIFQAEPNFIVAMDQKPAASST
jgi:hypothetical protein